MSNLPTLTPEEIKFFHENGYLGPIKLYEPEEAKAILHKIRKKSYDKSNSVFQNDLDYDRHFDISELTTHFGHPGIIGRLRALLGHDILGWRMEYHAKFPGSVGTEWHQVETYRFASGRSIIMPTKKVPNEPYDLTVWTTFTPATKENGCMKFIPKSHKKLYFDESKQTINAVQGNYRAIDSGTAFYGYTFADYKIDPEWDPDEEEFVSLEMQPGECVFFTALCVHGSHPNITKKDTRFAVSSRYVPTHTRVYPDITEYDSHGCHFRMDRYATALLSGQDIYHYNKITRENFMGEAFPYYPSEEQQQITTTDIAALWREILHFADDEKIGEEDNFFDIGGHSLHLVEVLSKLKHKFKVTLQAEDLFEYPTSLSLASFINGKSGSRDV